jgi:tRNA threonylcarbamoyladenosine biosynthesis protein TsaB
LAVLASQAVSIAKENDLIIPMIDARRMEVYSAIFNNKLEKVREIEAQIIDENSFASIENTVYFIGDSSEKAKAVLTKSNFIFLDEIVYPSAKDMSAISFQKFLNKDFEDVAYFEPFYLKDFLITTSKK